MSEFLMHREIVCKIAGVCLVLVAAGGFGHSYCRQQRLRLEHVRQIQHLMLLLYGEIEYQCSTLPEAFVSCGRQVNRVCGLWFIKTGERLNERNGSTFQEIWDEQLMNLNRQTALPKYVIDDLQRLGGQLSYPDRKTQLGALELYCQRLKSQEESFTKELPMKLKIGTTLGVLGGFFLIMLLI